ncbi:MAG: thioether cross-link-forming SCIFF peptide maturase [Lachnospiraceae bacterium]|nr:thioether cross-link-forming SCIFF peptide maturase [Lachnospiraceae bacterium]
MIHKFKAKDLNIVLDVNSGAVHVVDDISYDLLDEVKPPFSMECPKNIIDTFSDRYKEEDIKEAYEELKNLYNEKMLFMEDQYEVYANTRVKSPIKSICLHVSHDCNLRCKYCFASTGDFGKGRKLMPLSIGKAAIDFLIKESPDRPNLEVDFFGGEPMMNFGVVKDLVAYSLEQGKIHNKNFRFTITTNGMIMNDEAIDFINKYMDNVVLSIDGRKEINDAMRVRVDGKGSYDIIIENFKKLVAKRGKKEYYVRGTYTRNNLDFANDILSLYDEGFKEISVEPVMDDPTKEYSLQEEDLERIYEEYDKLVDEISKIRDSGKYINFFHFMIDLNQGPCIIKRLRGCGSGNEYVAVTPDGDIYPCHQFVGNEDFLMGNVLDGEIDQDIKTQFAGAHVFSKPKCRECWARFYCSGGCNANNYIFNGDILDSYDLACGIQKKRLESAILMKILEMLKQQ